MPNKEVNADPRRPSILDDVTVEYVDGRREVNCFCGMKVNRSVVPHFKKEHPTIWEDWLNIFIELRGEGYPLSWWTNYCPDMINPAYPGTFREGIRGD